VDIGNHSQSQCLFLTPSVRLLLGYSASSRSRSDRAAIPPATPARMTSTDRPKKIAFAVGDHPNSSGSGYSRALPDQQASGELSGVESARVQQRGAGNGSDPSASKATAWRVFCWWRRRNQPSRYDEELRRNYQRLKFRRGTAVAKVAIARKLAVRLYWQLRKRASPSLHNKATKLRSGAVGLQRRGYEVAIIGPASYASYAGLLLSD
jgi:hypothetical protein